MPVLPLDLRPAARPARPLRRLLVAAVLVAAGGGLTACGSGGDSSGTAGAGAHRVKVVATTSQLGDIVREVGGDAVDVHQVLRPNTDPHEYEPRPADVAETAGAKVVFASGLGLDGWIDDVAKESGGRPTIVTVGDGVPTKLAGDEEHEGGADAGHGQESGFDPHWWHDPTNVEQAIGVVRDAVAKADPGAAAAVRRSAAVYLAKVRALDAGIRACLAKVPRDERRLVTSHDAFGYFAHRYGITVVGAAIPSQTTQAQPSAGQVAALTKLIEREHVKAIFPESSVNPKLADAIAKETGASSDLTLYGDTLGAAGSDGATYVAMEQHNADAMVRGFTGGADRCSFGR